MPAGFLIKITVNTDRQNRFLREAVFSEPESAGCSISDMRMTLLRKPVFLLYESDKNILKATEFVLYILPAPNFGNQVKKYDKRDEK